MHMIEIARFEYVDLSFFSFGLLKEPKMDGLKSLYRLKNVKCWSKQFVHYAYNLLRKCK